MARPRKTPSDVLSVVRRVRFTADQWAAAKQHAHAAGLSVENYIRQKAAGAIVRAKPSRLTSEVVRELKAMGNNVNQIAKVANTTSRIDPRRLDATIDAILGAMRKLAKGSGE